MDGWVGGWMVGLVDGSIDRQTNKQAKSLFDRQHRVRLCICLVEYISS